jgi:hypothetical protein
MHVPCQVWMITYGKYRIPLTVIAMDVPSFSVDFRQGGPFVVALFVLIALF